VSNDKESPNTQNPITAIRVIAFVFVAVVFGYQMTSGKEPYGTAIDRVNILETGTNIYSQTGEELAIRDFFQDRPEGVFLDVGSAHYRLHSTTYYLEEHLGWTGVAVDALTRYRADYEKHRPKTRFFAYLVSDKSDEKEKFYQLDNNLLMSTVAKERAEKFAGGAVTELELSTITLNDLLDRAGVKKINFLSMDIEDAEPAALAGFDIKRFQPELVCIEAHPPIQDQLTAYFEKHNYKKIKKYSALRGGLNWYYTPE
jgi:FkbM family methyltransferase